jgi:hypothetical protein
MVERMIEKLELAMHHARRDARDVTHWLMTNDAYDLLRSETRGMVTYPAKDERPQFHGLPIYRTRELPEPGWLLREGAPPDDDREEEVRQRLLIVQREYQMKSRPLIEELYALQARKPVTPPSNDHGEERTS